MKDTEADTGILKTEATTPAWAKRASIAAAVCLVVAAALFVILPRDPTTPPTLPPIDVSGGFGNPVFGDYYSGIVNDSGILVHIAGLDRYDEYAKFREANKFDENGNVDLTRLYLREGIEYLGITKEEFIAANNALTPLYIEDGLEWAIFPSDTIDALFLEDKEERTLALLNPNVLYRDGTFLNIFDLLNLAIEPENMENLPFSGEELLAFGQMIHEKMMDYDRVNEADFYSTWLRPYFDNLEKTVSEHIESQGEVLSANPGERIAPTGAVDLTGMELFWQGLNDLHSIKSVLWGFRLEYIR